MAVTAEDERTAVMASVPASELVRALTNALLAMSKHADQPILRVVHITWMAGVLFFTTTDRCILLRESLDIIESDGSGQLLLADQDARNLIKIIGKSPGPVLATLSLAGNQLTVSTDVTTLVICPSMDPDDYPNADPCFADWVDTPRSFCQVALRPDYLARLAKLRPEESGAPLRLQLGHSPNQPVAFQMGTRLAGVLMPVRLTG